jgi:hypothetical protein
MIGAVKVNTIPVIKSIGKTSIRMNKGISIARKSCGKNFAK